MSQSGKKTCSFFNRPGGCRFGDRCRDEHKRAEGGHPFDTPARYGRSKDQQISRAPHGKCDFFWSTGFCKRAFRCKFEHVLSPDAAGQKENGIGSTNTQGSSRDSTILPFLTTIGLSNLSGTGGDAFRDSSDLLDPQQTHGHLRVFLRDNFRFRTTTQMCSFAKLLANASSMNTTWVRDMYQCLPTRLY